MNIICKMPDVILVLSIFVNLIHYVYGIILQIVLENLFLANSLSLFDVLKTILSLMIFLPSSHMLTNAFVVHFGFK